jgi:hypothetical protein
MRGMWRRLMFQDFFVMNDGIDYEMHETHMMVRSFSFLSSDDNVSNQASRGIVRGWDYL